MDIVVHRARDHTELCHFENLCWTIVRLFPCLLFMVPISKVCVVFLHLKSCKIKAQNFSKTQFISLTYFHAFFKLGLGRPLPVNSVTASVKPSAGSSCLQVRHQHLYPQHRDKVSVVGNVLFSFSNPIYTLIFVPVSLEAFSLVM